MKTLEDGHGSPEGFSKAQRAKRTILWVMAILMLLPVVLIWITGAISF